MGQGVVTNIILNVVIHIVMFLDKIDNLWDLYLKIARRYVAMK